MLFSSSFINCYTLNNAGGAIYTKESSLNVKKSNFHNVDDVLYFTNDVTKEAILTKYDIDAKGMVKIQDTVSINGIDYTITEIDDYAFRNCNLIESIVFSDSIEKIGKNAFDSCTDLKNIEISSSIKQIEPSSFAYCNHLESIKVDPNNNCVFFINTLTSKIKKKYSLLPANKKEVVDFFLLRIFLCYHFSLFFL